MIGIEYDSKYNLLVITAKRHFKAFTLLLVLVASMSFVPKDLSEGKAPKNTSVEFFMQEYLKDFHPDLTFGKLIFVSIKHQKIYFLQNGKVVTKYNVSTSKYGVGNTSKSQKTPVGLHSVKQKFGAGTPVNGIIKFGYYSGEKAEIITEAKHIKKDYITTRILAIEGLEPGINSGPGIDSFKRSIYIHGTAEEGLIGQPASHGCIRMYNKEVLELFNKVPKGCYVLILDH